MRKQGQSDRGLAKASGVNYVTVYYLRHGKGGMSGVGTIYNLAKALSCSPAWLAFGHGSETDPF